MYHHTKFIPYYCCFWEAKWKPDLSFWLFLFNEKKTQKPAVTIHMFKAKMNLVPQPLATYLQQRLPCTQTVPACIFLFQSQPLVLGIFAALLLMVLGSCIGIDNEWFSSIHLCHPSHDFINQDVIYLPSHDLYGPFITFCVIFSFLANSIIVEVVISPGEAAPYHWYFLLPVLL